MAAEAAERWTLGDNDRTLLRKLVTDLRRLAPIARSDADHIALDDAIEAIEKVRDGAPVEAVVTLSVGVQDGNDAFSEGWYMRLGLGPEGIVLDKLNTTYSVEMGLERFIKSYAVLKPGGGFETDSVAAWLEEVNELRRWSTAEIHGERIAL